MENVGTVLSQSETFWGIKVLSLFCLERAVKLLVKILESVQSSR